METKKIVREPARELPVFGEYDVIVAGGGVAGVAAALSAARAGARTLLLEREYLLGGLATLGLVTIYLPLCDGRGHQVSFGVAEELLRLSVSHGAEVPLPRAWAESGNVEDRARARMEVRYNANLFACLAEKQLADAGVEILFGTTLCDAVTEGGGLRYVIVENKSGRGALYARGFVDATGDADLCALAGEETAYFAQGNVLAAWYYATKGDKNALQMLGCADIPDKEKRESGKSGTAPLVDRRFGGLSAKELSEMVCLSHKIALSDFLAGGDLADGHALTMLPTIPQIRMTRRLSGQYTMRDEEMHRRFSDSIGMIGDWRKSGPIYELPFGILCGRRIGNLFAAGRCISVEDAMWDITRVIPACAVTGEAAGLAAAVTDGIHAPEVTALQEKLYRAGGKLHIDEAVS